MYINLYHLQFNLILMNGYVSYCGMPETRCLAFLIIITIIIIVLIGHKLRTHLDLCKWSST